MMDQLLWTLSESGSKCVAYADNVLLIVEGRNRMDLELKGTEWMKIVSEWGANVGVSVSESMTVRIQMKEVLWPKLDVRMYE